MKVITIALWSAMMFPASIFSVTLAQADQSPRGVAEQAPKSSATWIGGYRYSGSPGRQQARRTWTLRIDDNGNCLMAVSESTLMHEVACSWTADATSALVIAKDQLQSRFGTWDADSPLFRLEWLASGKLVTRWLGLDESGDCRSGEECFVSANQSKVSSPVPTQARLSAYQQRVNALETRVVRSAESVGSNAPTSITRAAEKVTGECKELLDTIQGVQREGPFLDKCLAGDYEPRRELAIRRLDGLASLIANLEFRALGTEKVSRAILAERAKKVAAEADWETAVAEFDQAQSRCKMNAKQCQSACKENPRGVECVVLADAYKNGDTNLVPKRDILKAGNLADPPCKSGIKVGCRVIDVIKKHATQCAGVEDCKPYCDARLGDACSAIGGYYINGDGVHVDAAKAFAYRQKGCDLGSAEGCLKAGIHFMQGWGTAKNWTKAEKDLARCCEMKEPVGCQLHAELCWRMGTCR